MVITRQSYVQPPGLVSSYWAYNSRYVTNTQPPPSLRNTEHTDEYKIIYSLIIITNFELSE